MNLKAYRPKGLALPAGLAGVIAGTSVLLNILLWLIVLITFPKSSPNAILHYTAGVGIDFIGNGWQIITLPSIGAFLICVNIILARYVRNTSRIAFWILWMSMPLLQILLLGTYGILLSFNT
ncbi:MAG: hypothetical protein O3A36_04080 [bacterium]|nr:hypothetical protein [bacterium]